MSEFDEKIFDVEIKGFDAFQGIDMSCFQNMEIKMPEVEIFGRSTVPMQESEERKKILAEMEDAKQAVIELKKETNLAYQESLSNANKLRRRESVDRFFNAITFGLSRKTAKAYFDWAVVWDLLEEEKRIRKDTKRIDARNRCLKL